MPVPMNNLKEGHFESSSLMPSGASGESRNASYGPKACEYEDSVTSMRDDADMFNHAQDGFRVGKTSGPSEKHFGNSNP